MIKGRLLNRMIMNKNRLLDDIYSYPLVLEHADGWPGDFPGRAMLGLASHYYAFEGDSNAQKEILNHLNEIFNHLDEKTNKDSYFGDLFDSQKINEQQLSGNSWYIRGLCGYYEITKSSKALKMINSIIDNFLLKVAPFFKTYPIYSRALEGEVSGHIIDDKESNWLLSSDVGCAYILLDGYVTAYETTKDNRLKVAIESLITEYLKIDPVSLKCQTHATLTSCRAILRMYKLEGKKEYLNITKSMFDKYVNLGLTREFENMNWYNRPDSWTEPCCVVDSWILSKGLFDITSEEKYLRFYNRSVTNGLRTLQRINGGAGCTTVTTDSQNLMKCFVYEAYFCCSMRLGEGFRYLCKNVNKDNKEYLIYLPESYENEDFSLDFDLYADNKLTYKTNKDISVKIVIPQGFKIISSEGLFDVKDGYLYLKDKEVIINYELEGYCDNKLHFVGDMLLTRKENEDGFTPLLDSSKLSEEELSNKIQYLW